MIYIVSEAKQKKLELRKIRRERRQKRAEKEKQLEHINREKQIQHKFVELKDPENIDQILIIKCLDTGEKFTLRDVDVSTSDAHKPITAFVSIPTITSPPAITLPSKNTTQEGSCLVQ